MRKTKRNKFSLICDYCSQHFACRSAKSRHIKMNRCPELKNKFVAGEMDSNTKKQKVLHESVIVRSEPEQ
jgi:hypothetical protein